MAKIDALLSDQQLKIYDLIRLAGWEGKTCDEIEQVTGYTHQAASARVHELLYWPGAPLIGRRGAQRKTRAGRKAFIYVLAELLDAKRREDDDAK